MSSNSAISTQEGVDLEAKVWNLQIAAFNTVDDERRKLQEFLVTRVTTLTKELITARVDLDDEAESRRNWRRRAELAESRVSRSLFAVLLIDGNNFIFKSDSLRAGYVGAVEISEALQAEARTFVKGHHLGDVPEDLQILVYVFADMDRLATALRESGTLTGDITLKQFMCGLCQSNPHMSFTDCGSGKAAVEAKMKLFYELYVENCQCRHIVLALDPSSEYFAILDSYADDELTLSKTSLVKSFHGFPGQYKLPYSVAEFASLEAVPLISLGIGGEEMPPDEVQSSSTLDLQCLEITQDIKVSLPATLDTNVQSPSTIISQKSVLDKVSTSETSGANSPSVIQFRQPNRSPGSGASRAPSHSSSHDSSLRLQRVTKRSMRNREYSSERVEHTVAPALASEPPPQQVTYKEAPELETASGKNDWENAPPQSLYTAPSELTPWGASGETSWADSVNEETARRDHTLPTNGNSYWENRKSYYEPRDTTGWNGSASRTAVLRDRKTQFSLNSSDSKPAIHLTSGLSSWRSGQPAENPDIFPIKSDVCINRYGQRIDAPLPKVSEADQARFDSRRTSRKLCNEHHLRRACHSQRCGFDHDPVDEGMRLALRHLSRQAPCPIGPACRRVECFYGHHCPRRVNNKCKNPGCVFKARGMHDVVDYKITEIIRA